VALQDDVRNLSSVPALRDLEQDALRLIAFSAETRILRSGDILFREGDVSDGGYVVLSGGIVFETGSGAPQTVAWPPALIGAAALIAETRRPATGIAREPSSVLKISRDLFRRVLSEYPESAIRLRRSLADRVAGVRRDLDDLRQVMLGEL
jgi:CRP-like cAMP-binding protein